jgi:hypothetical protein
VPNESWDEHEDDIRHTSTNTSEGRCGHDRLGAASFDGWWCRGCLAAVQTNTRTPTTHEVLQNVSSSTEARSLTLL